MSTYLVAFAIGEFDYIEEVLSNGVVARIYTPLGKKEQGRFALQVNREFPQNVVLSFFQWSKYWSDIGY